MKLQVGLFFIVAGLIAGVPLRAANQEELATRYEAVRALRDAATSDEARQGYDAQLDAIIRELAYGAAVSVDVQPQPSTQQVEQLPVAVAPESDTDEDLKTILETKLDTVFQSFINKNDLDSNAIVLADTMKHYFIVKLEQFDVSPQAVQAEIIIFVEMARLLLCRMQLLVGSPMLVRKYFGELPISLIDKKRLSDLFVKALYAATIDDDAMDRIVKHAPQTNDSGVIVKYARGALVAALTPWPLVTVLAQEGVVSNSWRVDWRLRWPARQMAAVFNVVLSFDLVDLMQQYLNLENSIAMIPDLKNLQQDAFVRKFILQADALINKLLKEYSVLARKHDVAAEWANLFIGKTILLKRAMLVRVQVARGGKYEKTRREVYVKNDVLTQDPLFNDVLFIPELRGYASRYESLVTRFLMGQTDAAIDYYRDHQMLLAHLRTLVGKITPQGWRVYVYGVTGNGLYAPLINNMINILEDIGRALQYGDSMFGAAQGFVADLLSDKGLLVGLGGKELQAAASKLGFTPEQVKTLLAGASGNPKEFVLRILAGASPLLVRGIMDYVSNSAGKPALKADALKERTSPLAGDVNNVTSGVDSSLVARIDKAAPGLLDLLTGHVKTEFAG